MSTSATCAKNWDLLPATNASRQCAARAMFSRGLHRQGSEMRSLFWKIFLSFWATVILTAIALVLTFALQRGSVPERWHNAMEETARVYGTAAIQEIDRGGPAAANEYLQRVQAEAHTAACVFDRDGRVIAGDDCVTFLRLAEHAARTNRPELTLFRGLVRVALPLKASQGGEYIFAVELPAGPRAAFGPSLSGVVLHWAVALGVSGLVCYLLARYLTAPILRLREASKQLSAGNLATRAAPE